MASRTVRSLKKFRCVDTTIRSLYWTREKELLRNYKESLRSLKMLRFVDITISSFILDSREGVRKVF